MKAFSILLILFFAVGIFGPELLVRPAFGQDPAKVLDLQQLIEAQQMQQHRESHCRYFRI